MPNKLFWKLGLSYLLLPFLVIVLVDFFSARMLRQDYERAGFDELAALMRVAEKDFSQINDAAASAAAQRWSASGARVTVIRADGSVIADSQRDPALLDNHAARPEVRRALEHGEGREVRFSDSVNRDLLYLAKRLETPDGSRVLRMALPLRQVEGAATVIRMRLWGVLLVVLAVAMAGALWLSRGLSRRVESLTQFARRVADGDFSPVPAEHRGDEISELTRAMNQTAARLKETIASLGAEKEQSATILRSMVEGVAAVSPEERILFMNDAFCRELGVDAATSAGRAMVEAVRQPDLIELVRKAQAAKQQSSTEMTLASAASPRTFSVTAAPVSAAGGVAVVLVLHDITELRRLERIRRDFVANVSHEFKTPLTAIQGFAETLLGGALDDSANNRRFVEIIREHSVRLARLTEDLLTLSRIEAGKLELSFQAVTVADLVEQCAETTGLKASQKNIAFTMEIRENLPAVRGDVQRLGEVLQNLLDNAVQYTNSGGKVTLAVDVAPGAKELAIAVRDTGIGIPRHELERIFERFYRVDAARSREAGGTGLGLSIARHLAEAHGGRLEVQSEAGKGSTFTLFVPLSA